MKKFISKNLYIVKIIVIVFLLGSSIVYATDIGADLIRIGADGTDGQLSLYSEQGGTDYEVTFQPNAAMTQDTDYTLPADDGNASEVLSTDGNGALSWISQSGADFSDGGEAGGADRTLGNTDNYDLSFLTNNLSRLTIDNDGDIGINVSSPSYSLDILRGSGPIIRALADNGDSEFEVFAYLSDAFLRLSNDNSEAVIKFGSENVANQGWALIGRDGGENYRLDIASGVDVSQNDDDKGTTMVTVLQGGNLGIGAVSPGAELEVDGGIRLNPDDASKPSCDASHRGELWFTESGAGVADTLEVCGKDAGDSYAWRTLW